MDAQLSPVRTRHIAEWSCAAVGLAYALFVLVTLLSSWGRTFDSTKIGVYVVSAALMFVVPLSCSIVALVGTRHRARGRVGFLAFAISLVAIALWVADLAFS